MSRSVVSLVLALLILGGSTEGSRGPKSTRLLQLYGELKSLVEDDWDDINDPRWHALGAFTGSNNLASPDEVILRTFAQFGDLLEATAPQRTTVEERAKILSGPLGNLFSWASADVQMGAVDALYQTFRRFQTRPAATTATEASRKAMSDLAETVLQKSPPSVPAALDRLHELATSVDGGGVFGNLPSVLLLDGGNGLCSIHQSPQQLIFNLYNLVTLTEIKGYAMMQFSWMLLKLYNKGNFTLEAELMRERVEARMDEKIQAARTAMGRASQELWVCDPSHHEENETFVQLTNVLQGHIENEVDLNPKGTCRESCGYYQYARVHDCYKDQFCKKQPKCNGRIFDCRFIDSDASVCLSKGGSTHRKYDWIEYENGRTLGRKGTCERGSTKVDSWWRWLFWHCSYCLCLCDEVGLKSDRYFSLHPSLARGVEESFPNSNRAVTGLRFVKVNRVIHLQVQDGEILPGGLINSSTVEWRPIKPFKVTDNNIRRDVDYHIITWEQRAVDLDDLKAPEGSILTGVQLRRIGAHLNLEILTTPFNFTTGKLAHRATSEWISNDNTPAAVTEPRKEIRMYSPDVPTKCPTRSSVVSNHDQYIRFTHSDIDRDVAQTTVPFIDAQPVVPDPHSLLTGAGLFYKGKRNCGGFISLKVMTYDYSKHLHMRDL
ncbi:uncharacterized protein LOC124158779 isoform X3 [Ischnura elegans]|uniref:uncharacterized protein LOC124158779 isoform X3 n=1 Tax=Ischnura elegans TaxID=197161 RepID=UPI001ED8A49C|nr:uncharacterized protein LOC124158779 isoform X3 [Ischnura elegans]